MRPRASRTKGKDLYRFLKWATSCSRTAMSRFVVRMSGGGLTFGCTTKKINVSMGIIVFLVSLAVLFLRPRLLARESQCVHDAHVSNTGSVSASMLVYTKSDGVQCATTAPCSLSRLMYCMGATDNAPQSMQLWRGSVAHGMWFAVFGAEDVRVE